MARIADSDRELRKQGVWVRQQTKAREQRRQRANHLLEVRQYTQPFLCFAQPSMEYAKPRGISKSRRRLRSG